LIAYLDTSALVKLFVMEVGSRTLRALIERFAASATSVIAYAEARAAFARRHRERTLSSAQYQRVVAEFEERWETLLGVEASMPVIRVAGTLAERHSLRGFDAIHLASGLDLQTRLPEPITFCCADARLNAAAAAEGLKVEAV